MIKLYNYLFNLVAHLFIKKVISYSTYVLLTTRLTLFIDKLAQFRVKEL